MTLDDFRDLIPDEQTRTMATAAAGWLLGTVGLFLTRSLPGACRAVGRWRARRRASRAAARLEVLAADLSMLHVPTLPAVKAPDSARLNMARRKAAEKGYETTPCTECGQLTVVRSRKEFVCDCCAAHWTT